VLKDILLVFASMMLFKDPVSLLQAFGYSIALGGLIFYKLGGEKLKDYVGQGSMAWAQFGQARPVARKLVILGAVFISFFMIVGAMGPSIAPDQTNKFYDGIGNIMSDKGA
jgi:hypothetical protein